MSDNPIKNRWAHPTWIFLHCISEKIHPEFYRKNHKEFIDKILKTILNNLPCPACAHHSKSKINMLKYEDINTKEKLKKWVFDFHNEVNSRIGKQVFPINILEQYKTYNIKRIYYIFLNRFFTSYYTGAGMGSVISKRKTKQIIIYFFNKHKGNIFKG